jgi:hypothetical protein
VKTFGYSVANAGGVESVVRKLNLATDACAFPLASVATAYTSCAHSLLARPVSATSIAFVASLESEALDPAATTSGDAPVAPGANPSGPCPARISATVGISRTRTPFGYVE